MIQIIRNIREISPALRGGALSVGNFDGVHRGHAALVRELVHQAKSVGGPAVVMTFDPPPVAILAPERALTPPLTTIERRAELLEKLGVDAVIAYPTDRQLLDLSADEFFRRIIIERLNARAMVEGPNFCFGKDRQGTIERLRELCQQHNVTLSVVPPAVDAHGRMISSTRIRGLIAAGQIAEANQLLTQPYQLEGTVSKGAGRGEELGFPTANLDNICCLLPAQGVYAGGAWLQRRLWPAAIHIGPNPTFDDQRSKLEVHVIDWKGQLYGEQMRVSFFQRLRDVRPFPSVAALREQLAHDIETARQIALQEIAVWQLDRTYQCSGEE